MGALNFLGNKPATLQNEALQAGEIWQQRKLNFTELEKVLPQIWAFK
jgi:hypothetical protein